MKRIYGLLCSTAMLAAIAAAPASAQDTQHKWRMTSHVPETSIIWDFYISNVAKRITDLTDGEIEVTPYPAGVIAPPFEAVSAVQDGTADALNIPLIYLVNQDPANGILGALPGGMSAETLFHWMYKGGGKELLAEFHEATLGIHSLPCGIGASELFGHAHKPIRTAEDLKGIKFRTSGPMADVLQEYFDAAPTVVPGSEVYTMLERAGIDIAEWSGPADNLGMGFHEVAEYIMYPGPQVNAFFHFFAVSKDTWDGLPDRLKYKVEAACQLASVDGLLSFDAADIEAWKKIKQGKNQLVRIDDSLIAAFRDAARAWSMKRAEEQKAQGNEWTEKIANAYWDFYDNWRQNTEYRYIDTPESATGN